ncbi:MAG: phospholipid scramblase-related protein [Acidimicrobiia bacterium]
MSNTPANWYPDPMGRHELRYWDGARWTEHVSTSGQTAIDHLDGAQPVALNTSAQKIQEQVQTGGARGAGIAQPSGPGGGTIFTEPILVVNQKAKILEVTNQYAVFDQGGRQIASVTQVGQSAAKKVLRVLTSLDQFMTHKLEIRDADGQVQLLITRPAKVFKSTVVVESAAGQEIGRIVQDNVFGKIHFSLEANGQTLGSINAENWRAWNFRIEDAAGTEVARITKTFEGIAKTLFTTADNYVVQIHAQLPQPFLSLVVASALSVDTALKQDSRGLG